MSSEGATYENDDSDSDILALLAVGADGEIPPCMGADGGVPRGVDGGPPR